MKGGGRAKGPSPGVQGWKKPGRIRLKKIYTIGLISTIIRLIEDAPFLL